MIYTISQALERLKKYCAYQERSQAEVRQKLFQLGIKGEDAEEVISELITENFLNEERFARAYARGKFKIKKWGRIKITSGLKQKGVSETCIKYGLSEISESSYQNLVLSETKKLLKPKAKQAEIQKAIRKLRTQGFEVSYILKAIDQLNN